uniref:Cyclopropane-fatty-acyl-phospholipid synthase n=1 Tax=Panagrolaimus sp. JU765 TaxID=591449 RepID=A0AC34Q4N2_9BILA
MFLDRKLGLAEAYLDNAWNASPGPKDLLTLLIRARRESPKSEKTKQVSFFGSVLSFFADLIRKSVALFNYLQHKWRQNTIHMSQKNIKDHYDLGNELFKLFLDDTMTYSCGVFKELPLKVEKSDRKLLEDAQKLKYDLLFERLELEESDHVLEIGCGWMQAAIQAVQKYNCKWTGLTISEEQFAFAKQRVKDAGLEANIEIKFLDYRKETGVYDKILSIEMIEAVGHEFLPVYFGQISKNLKPGGIAAIQAILCLDQNYEQYRNSSDFIKKHIFPGGHMPSLKAISEALPPELSMKPDARKIGRHYAPTLDLWNCAWMENKKQIHKLGYSEFFHRKWEFYFVLCSALFEYGNIDTAQISFVKSSA